MKAVKRRGILFVLPVLIGFAMALLGYPEFTVDGLTVDPDTQTRIAFLAAQLEHGTLTDYHFMRSGAPGGMQLHWTLPFDLLCTLLAAPMAAFEGWHAALLHAALACGPLGYLCLCLAVLWLVRSAGMWHAAPWALLPMAFCSAVDNYAVPGRMNHHLFTVAAATAALAASVAMVRRPGIPRALAAAGMAVLAAWQSVEALGTVAAALGLAVLASTAAASGPARRAFLAYAAALPLAGGLVLLLDPDPAGLLALSTDRLSALTVAGLLAAGILAAAAPVIAGRGHLARRCAILAAAAGAAALPLGWLALRHLPLVLGDPDAMAYFWYVGELRPAWSSPGFALMAACPGLPAMLLAGWTAWRRRPGPARTALVLCCLVLAADLAMSALHARMDPYQVALGSAVLGCGARAWACRWLRDPRGQVVDRAFAAVAAAACVVTLVSGARAVAAPGAAPETCTLGRDVAANTQALLPPGAVVAVGIQQGPELLARTGLRTIAGPYHRDVEGIHDLAEVFGGTDPEVARRILVRRGAAGLLNCDVSPQASLSAAQPGAAARPKSVSQFLASEDAPLWLTPVYVDPSGRYRLFLLRDRAPPE